MDDKKYEATKKRIRKFVDKWSKPMGLGWFKIDVTYDRNCSRDGSHTQAETDMSAWRYHEFTITFYITDVMELSDEELENTVVHELVHCLLAPISCNMRETDTNSDYRRDIMEFNTQLVVKAFDWVRRAGEDDAKAQAKSDKIKSKEKSNATNQRVTEKATIVEHDQPSSNGSGDSQDRGIAPESARTR